jgi:hypothetical protein
MGVFDRQDGNMHCNSSFFDMRICIYVSDILSNLHMVALLQDGQWIEVVYMWCMHLCCQEKLIMDMNSEMCPKKMN